MDEHLGAGSLARLLRGWREGAGAGTSAQTALAARISSLLADGRLAVGTRVPSERELATALDVGRGTVAAAYEELREDGYLLRRRGSGTWTSQPAVPVSRTDAAPAPLDGVLHVGPTGFAPFAPIGAMGAPPAQAWGREVIDLAHAAPWAPMEAMAEAGARALAELPMHLAGSGYDVLGLPALREAVAARLSAQGLRTTADEIMITAGAQHAHALVARALVRPGDRVLLEQPTYPGAIDLVRHTSARPVPVAMTEHDGTPGWDVEAIAAAMRASTPAVGYLVPDHQNPTGAVMSAETRAAVVAAAARHGVPLVVDDCLREMWLDAPTPPPLGAWSVGGGTPVITTGSLSKTVWGGLRIGWMRAPRTLLRRIAGVRASDDISTPVLEQLVAVALFDRLDEIIAESRRVLVHRREHLRDALARALPEWRTPRPPGGFSLWIDLGVPRSSALVEAAGRAGIHLAAGPRFGTGGAFEQYLRLPYTLSPDALDDAVARLAEAWDALGAGAPTLTTVV
ncbi:MocR-like transcription factor YczR [Actinomycetospora sp. C-140]